MLKVDQSVEDRQPCTEADDTGQLMTKAIPVPLVEVEMLKMFPAVPVETLFKRFEGKLRVNRLVVVVEILNTSPTVVVAMDGITLAMAVIKPLPLAVV